MIKFCTFRTKAGRCLKQKTYCSFTPTALIKSCKDSIRKEELVDKKPAKKKGKK